LSRSKAILLADILLLVLIAAFFSSNAAARDGGGQASYFVACAHSDRIRAIAPVAMPMPTYLLDECADVPGTGIAILNGTDDPLVPYDGGRIKVGKRERDEVMSTDATVDFWRARNVCSTDAIVETINTRRDRMQVQKTRWEQCEQASVVLYRIEGGGHTWPSGRQYLPRFAVGRVNRDIDGAEEAWSFFSQFQ
jgi:polyhydroxybutyrate depolymerase